MKEIDVEKWGRRELFEFFSSISQPFYSVTFTLDVTKLYNFVKNRGLSFYYSLVYLSTNAINSIEAFRYSLHDGKIVLLPGRNPSFTDLKPGSETFHIVTMPIEREIEEFCRKASMLSRNQDCFIHSEAESEALIFFSCLPWVELTGLTNERDFNRDDAIPRIAWGKYTDNGGKLTLGMSLEVNHRFIDGFHIGLFAKQLEAEMEKL